MKKIITGFVDKNADKLLCVPHDIHAHPELAFEKVKASKILTNTAEDFGLRVERSASGSTDMGNVSHRVPSIYPMLAVAQNVIIHNPEFSKWAGSTKGDQAALAGAKVLALTAADYLTNPKLQVKAKHAFEVSIGLC
jgi:metal-dependent amidase/aminoacylase/carboxypeptidase family protein